MVITGTTQLLGVMGYPIQHSLSPVMHNAAIAELGLDYVYVPLEIEPSQLNVAISGLQAIGWRGFNVTIPHKQAIMTYLTEISAIAQAVGAVNTVWRTEQGWAGTNTDVTGFLAPLRPLTQDWQHTTALILGCGGAARAVVAACRELGCPEIWVVSRDLDKLQAFQHSWQHAPSPLKIEIATWAAMEQILPQAGLVVNCTPIGMAPHVTASPLSIAQIASLPSNALVYDLIYTPRPTKLLELASERGCLSIDGLEMLVQQGAAALEIWLGTAAPVAVMRQALLQRWRVL